jgi:hypothetical protein
MTMELYQEVSLTRDLAEYGLRAGDIATLVDFVPLQITAKKAAY